MKNCAWHLFYMLFFPYHLLVYNLFSDPVKNYFYAIIKLSFWSEKQQQNSQENSLGDSQNFSKNSFKYSQLSIRFK